MPTTTVKRFLYSCSMGRRWPSRGVRVCRGRRDRRPSSLNRDPFAGDPDAAEDALNAASKTMEAPLLSGNCDSEPD